MTRAPTLDRLTTVILNYNGADLSVRCARALVDDGVQPDRIVLVDNGSQDESPELLRSALPECVLAALDENVGYAKAANAGARRLSGDAYLIMNNDAFVHRRGSVSRLLHSLADASVGLAVPRLLNEDLTLQPTVRPLPTPGVSLARATGVGRLVPNRWQPSWSHHWDHRSSRAIQAADGAVVLVRGETWHQLGGYNEARRVYGEDLDLCWRTRKLGWRIWFEGGAEFVHLGNATWSRWLTDRQRARIIGSEESQLLYEHLSPARARLSLAATCMYMTWRAALFALAGNQEASRATKSARAEYVRGVRLPAPASAGKAGSP